MSESLAIDRIVSDLQVRIFVLEEFFLQLSDIGREGYEAIVAAAIQRAAENENAGEAGNGETAG